MKVAIFLGALIRGGMETLVLDVMRKQSIAPFDMICVYRKEGNYSDAFHATSVPMIQLKRKGGLLSYIFSLRKLFLDAKVDIVHVQTPSNALLCTIALIGTGIKLVTTMHGFSFMQEKSWKQNIVFRYSKQVVFVSRYQQQLYAQQLRVHRNIQHCPIVYNGIDMLKFEKQYERPNFLKKDNLSLAMIGSFRRVRSQKVIIEAVHELKKSGRWNEVKFYFIGGEFRGEEYRMRECEEAVKQFNLEKEIFFVGVRDDIPAVLQHIDGYVYSSENDTFGISVVEAMIAGVPVVVNDFEVMREITREGEWASLYKTDNAIDCAEKIEELIHNIENYKNKAKSNRGIIKETYSINRHIDNIYKVYQSL